MATFPQNLPFGGDIFSMYGQDADATICALCEQEAPFSKFYARTLSMDIRAATNTISLTCAA